MKPITLFTIVLTATVLMASFYMINASRVQSVPEALACNVSKQNDIVLYSAVWCGYCKQTKQLLAKHNVNYCEYDIERSAEGYEQFKMLGGQAVPLLQFNGSIIHGYNKSLIETHIQNQ